MKRMENKLFARQAEQMIAHVQDTETFRRLFLPLVVDAKETAHKNLMGNVPEYRAAEEKAIGLLDCFRENMKRSAAPELLQMFDDFLETNDITDSIWAEEMYLRGIQDAVAFILLISKENIYDVTGLSSL